jgi:cell division protein FtsL
MIRAVTCSNDLLRAMAPPQEPDAWFKPVLATAAISAAIALIGVYADMQVVKSDLSEVKGRSMQQEETLQELQTRVTKLEVGWQALRLAGLHR